jgi:hypothetical protein
MRLTNHDPGYQPWVISANKPTWRAIYDKLCEYEDAEEQGRLVELPPCKIGDHVFFIINGKVYSGDIYYLRYENYHGRIHSLISAASGYGNFGFSAEFSDWGKTVFPTKESAEAALKGETEDV